MVDEKMLNKAMKNAEKFNFEESLKGLTKTNELLQNLIDNVEQLVPAVASVYQALEVIAGKLDVELPDPYIDMKIEGD